MNNPLTIIWRRLHHDPVIRWSFRLTVLVYLCCVGFILWHWERLPTQIPLYYSLPWGEMQLASPLHLVIMTFALCLFVILNYILSLFLLRNAVFFVRLVVVGSAAFSLLFGISVVQIILLVT